MVTNNKTSKKILRHVEQCTNLAHPMIVSMTQLCIDHEEGRVSKIDFHNTLTQMLTLSLCFGVCAATMTGDRNTEHLIAHAKELREEVFNNLYNKLTGSPPDKEDLL